MIQTGIDILSHDGCRALKGRRIGLLANPASTTSDLRHTSDVLHSCGITPLCLFGPQHGYTGETQANMIEWEGYTHPKLGIPVYSLYGRERRPEQSVLENLDTVVIDLPDVGARPYTYLWTAVLMMQACAEAGVEILVCDRPNPIGGKLVEGPPLDMRFKSFVGLHPLPMRHGLTIAEALEMIHERDGIRCTLNIMKMEGWRRSMFYEDTEIPWILPSPNIPAVDTAMVYPGSVLIEGTNVSEGRGTTKPFEIIGAPWIDPDDFAGALSRVDLTGVLFRPLSFKPTWDMYRDELCGGVQLHVLDRNHFQPVRCGYTIIETAARLYPDHFRWKEPPYEYEWELLPIDLISGSASLRETIDAGGEVAELFRNWENEEDRFRKEREEYLLYER